MAEWLRRGLQILARRFDSGSGLHPPSEIYVSGLMARDMAQFRGIPPVRPRLRGLKATKDEPSGPIKRG